jgi:hypothetical protein
LDPDGNVPAADRPAQEQSRAHKMTWPLGCNAKAISSLYADLRALAG